ncbi:MAG: VCBS repeat-containing protein [Ignavibacteriaceae bacterium]
MKKHYKGERTGLKIELNKTDILFIVLFLSQNIFSQIPLNGFCKYSSIPVDSGYNSFFTLNYNDDSYTDLFLYNSNNKKTVSLSGDNNNFDKENVHDLPIEITKLQNFFDKNGKTKSYSFTSRKSRQIGLIKFDEKGRPEITSKLELNSYPENISVGDINNNGADEMLISGSNFEGLSVIFKKEDKLKEKKIIDKSIFSNAVLTDLSNDGYLDIAAFNVLTNSINFFYNSGNSNFKKVRSIQLNERISSLHSTDLNFDSYSDLIFVKGNAIDILYGDFSSAYQKEIILSTKNFPDKLTFGDFNKDGKIDIAYINFSESTLSIFFAKDDFEYYPELVYLKKENIKDMVPYYSKFISGLALLSSRGEIFTVTNLASISESPNITAGALPISIKNFDIDNNGIIDIAYLDKYTKTLNLLVRNSAGIPSSFYIFPLYESEEEILIDNSFVDKKTFYCYSPDKKLIEVLDINFLNNKISRNSLYAPGKIKNLKLKRVEEKVYLYCAYSKEEKLGMGIFEYKDQKFSLNNYPDLKNNFYTANISLVDEPSIFTWNIEKDSLKLSNIYFKNKNKNKNIFSLSSKNRGIVDSFLEDLFYTNKNVLLTFFKFETSKQLMIISGDFSSTFKNVRAADLFSTKEKNKFFFGEIKFNGLKKLFVYNPEKKIINKAEFINRGKNIVISKVADNINLESFFVKNMTSKNYHLVYINKLNGCISIQQL